MVQKDNDQKGTMEKTPTQKDQGVKTAPAAAVLDKSMEDVLT